MPKISVIVPVYKAEAFLERCVSSILKQTFRDIELILVDDGSPDSCPILCDNFAQADDRVRVIHKTNGGVSTARNAGLDAARGEYIAFVDSDDWLEADMYEKMIGIADNYNCDVVMCDCVKDAPCGSSLYSHPIRGGYYDKNALKTEHFPHLLIMENVEYPATISNWTLLWKNSLNTSKMRYEQGIRYSEDLLFGAKLVYAASSFYYMKGEAYYHYVMNPTSASHTYVPDKWNDYQRLHSKIKTEFENCGEFDFLPQIDLCLLFFLYNTVGEIYGAPMCAKDKREKICCILNTPSVREMFKRLNVGSLGISNKLKAVTVMYKYKIGISLLIAYFGRKK